MASFKCVLVILGEFAVLIEFALHSYLTGSNHSSA